MASGRRSSDPTNLLLVDPSQPEATQRARKHLTKRQKDIFIQYGFSKALLREVIGAGWDQVDINNYVLYYNSQVEASLAVPAPGLDMSIKKAINTIIRTKLARRTGRARNQCGNPHSTRRCHPQENPQSQIWECYLQDRRKPLVEANQP